MGDVPHYDYLDDPDAPLVVDQIGVCDECGEVGTVVLTGAALRCLECAGLVDRPAEGEEADRG